MLNTRHHPQTLLNAIAALWQRLITSHYQPRTTKHQLDLKLYGTRYPQPSTIGRRFPISPERAATMYRAADEAF